MLNSHAPVSPQPNVDTLVTLRLDRVSHGDLQQLLPDTSKVSYHKQTILRRIVTLPIRINELCSSPTTQKALAE